MDAETIKHMRVLTETFDSIALEPEELTALLDALEEAQKGHDKWHDKATTINDALRIAEKQRDEARAQVAELTRQVDVLTRMKRVSEGHADSLESELRKVGEALGCGEAHDPVAVAEEKMQLIERLTRERDEARGKYDGELAWQKTTWRPIRELLIDASKIPEGGASFVEMMRTLVSRLAALEKAAKWMRRAFPERERLDQMGQRKAVVGSLSHAELNDIDAALKECDA